LNFNFVWLIFRRFKTTENSNSGPVNSGSGASGPSTSASVNFANGYDQRPAPKKPGDGAFNFLEANRKHDNLTSVENNNKYFKFTDFAESDA